MLGVQVLDIGRYDAPGPSSRTDWGRGLQGQLLRGWSVCGWSISPARAPTGTYVRDAHSHMANGLEMPEVRSAGRRLHGECEPCYNLREGTLHAFLIPAHPVAKVCRKRKHLNRRMQEFVMLLAGVYQPQAGREIPRC